MRLFFIDSGRYFLPLSFLFLFLGGPGCTWREHFIPSILLVAVENLGYDSFSCGTEEIFTVRDFSGFQQICQESVRFTHAYTPSLMSQATLASIMTAQYPYQHGVRHNGAQFLSSRFKTVAEWAVQKKYRTSFFSGGPPIWRKSGLAQGFEFFDDNVRPTFAMPYRPVKETLSELMSWIKKEVSRDPFFSVVYLPDLQFPSITTANELGEIREKSFSSQLREIGESLGELISTLKKENRWDNTIFILAGLNNETKVPHLGEMVPYDLHSEAVQVALYIKPAQKKRDLGIEWKIDKNVSLVDVGATLFDFFEKPLENFRENSSQDFPIVSLRQVLSKPQVFWDQNRMILVESGWPEWRGVGAHRLSVRRGQYLIIYDERIKLYNTLIDRLEISPLSSNDHVSQSLVKQLEGSLKGTNYSPWEIINHLLPMKNELGRLLWNNQKVTDKTVKDLVHLANSQPQDSQIWGWLAQLALKQKNWSWLNDLGKKNHQEIWQFVARKNLGLPAKLSAKGCHLIFLHGTSQFKAPALQECEDELLIYLLKWVNETQTNLKQIARDQFLRLMRVALTDRRIAEWNYINYLQWDVNINEPSEPLLAELFLYLPKNKNYLDSMERLFLGEN